MNRGLSLRTRIKWPLSRARKQLMGSNYLYRFRNSNFEFNFLPLNKTKCWDPTFFKIFHICIIPHKLLLLSFEDFDQFPKASTAITTPSLLLNSFLPRTTTSSFNFSQTLYLTGEPLWAVVSRKESSLSDFNPFSTSYLHIWLIFLCLRSLKSVLNKS